MVTENHYVELNMQKYCVSPECGFLIENPLEKLPPYFEVWNDLGTNLWSFIKNHALRQAVNQMPLLDHTKLEGHRQYRLAHLLLSMIGSGYVWQEGDEGVVKTVPSNLAIPWCAVSEKLDIHPVLSHISLCLANWRLMDPTGPCAISNVDTIFKFPAGSWNCGWFMRVTVMIELQAVQGLESIVGGMKAMSTGNVEKMKNALDGMMECLVTMKKTLALMHDLDASHFYNTLRPFLNGWGGSSSVLPDGLIYEGVSDQPKQCIGGSAAQSCILHCYDEFLGIEHSPDKVAFLEKMRSYMLPKHREFIKTIGSYSLKDFVSQSEDQELIDHYNKCLKTLANFRSYHIQVAAKYIVVQATRQKKNVYESVSKQGTGGTKLMPFLKDIRDTTQQSSIN